MTRLAFGSALMAGLQLLGASSAFAGTAGPITTAHGSFGVAGVAAAALLVGLLAAKSNNMRDASLPQIAVRERSYSLGRSQMAFWTFLIIIAFIYLFVITGTSAVLSDDALMLMGISGTTGLGAVALDKSRDAPVKEAIEALQHLGLNTADDVALLDKQIMALRKQVAPDADTVARLKDAEDRRAQAEQLMRPFKTSGSILRDLVSEGNGATVHRLQLLVWTVILGWTFMADCYGAVKMPDLSNELLAVMGISGGTYFGFKAAS